jgi:hypothetical protein
MSTQVLCNEKVYFTTKNTKKILCYIIPEGSMQLLVQLFQECEKIFFRLGGSTVADRMKNDNFVFEL